MEPLFVKDEIHGKITLDPVAKRIIDTKYFQRLKNIRQLGFVYKYGEKRQYQNCGGYTRYEHSIGTYYLAGKYLEILQYNGDKTINDDFILCVKLAGLLHDIAHGPFSHFWGGEYLEGHYVHEDECDNCIDKIYEEMKKVKKNIITDDHIKLIKALIKGCSDPSKEFPDVPKFLFEIINNKLNKIDVDKWDYLRRDFHHCKEFLANQGLITQNLKKKLVSVSELFETAKISENNDHIEYQNWDLVYDLFDIRYLFFKHIYHLPEVRFLGEIIKTSLELLEEEEEEEEEKYVFSIKLNEIKPNNIKKYEDVKMQKKIEDDFMNLIDDKIIDLLKYNENYKINRFWKIFNEFNNKILEIHNSNNCDYRHVTFTICINYPGEEIINFRNKIFINNEKSFEEAWKEAWEASKPWKFGKDETEYSYCLKFKE